MRAGAGLPSVERLGYLAEFAMAQLEGLSHLVLVDAEPRFPSSPIPTSRATSFLPAARCTCSPKAATTRSARSQALADTLGVEADRAVTEPASRPDRPTGALTAETIATAIGALLPEGAIVADEGNTSGLFVSGMTAGAPPPRLAVSHRRSDRRWSAHGDRGGHGLPRPQGRAPGG